MPKANQSSARIFGFSWSPEVKIAVDRNCRSCCPTTVTAVAFFSDLTEGSRRARQARSPEHSASHGSVEQREERCAIVAMRLNVRHCRRQKRSAGSVLITC